MADISKIIPFILHFEAGVNKKYLGLPNEQIFEIAKKTGFANDPVDAGGATMCGVTLNTFKAYCRKNGFTDSSVRALRNMSYNTWLDIIKTLFWDKWKADEIKDQSVANAVVDWMWASGRYGITIPQRILDVAQDGIVGKKTLAALNAQDPKGFFDEVQKARLKYTDDIIQSSIRRYESRIGRTASPQERRKYTNLKYENGWKRRINSIIYGGFRYD